MHSHHDWSLVICVGTAVVSTGLLIFQHWYLRRLFLSASTHVVHPPHPNWSIGDKQPCPYPSDIRSIDPLELTGSECYPLVISGVVPRPIAFVSTLSLDGIGNLSPFSYFNAVSHDPPCVAVSICRSGQRGGGEKDTAKNIQETKYGSTDDTIQSSSKQSIQSMPAVRPLPQSLSPLYCMKESTISPSVPVSCIGCCQLTRGMSICREFVVNMISEWFIESANYTCAPFQADIDEMEITHLTPSKSLKIKPPGVQESAIQMECTLRHHYDIVNRNGDIHATVFIGEVVMFHIRQGVLTTTPSGKPAVDVTALRPMCRLGGNTYGRVTSIFDLPRPDRTV